MIAYLIRRRNVCHCKLCFRTGIYERRKKERKPYKSALRMKERVRLRRYDCFGFTDPDDDYDPISLIDFLAWHDH